MQTFVSPLVQDTRVTKAGEGKADNHNRFVSLIHGDKRDNPVFEAGAGAANAQVSVEDQTRYY